MKIAIRVDSSVEIGIGHVIRCLTLAGQLRAIGGDAAFICRDPAVGMFDLICAQGYRSTMLPQIGMDQQQSDADATIKACESLFPSGLDWLIVDHYQLDIEWERRLRPHVRRLMVIDDLANRKHDCDLLLDQNYYHNFDHRYVGLIPEAAITLLGPSYVLLRPEFIQAKQRLRARNGVVRRLLVFFGGSDPTNQTLKVLSALRFLRTPNLVVDVVVGSANPHGNMIRGICELDPNLVFHCQVSTMAELISSADIGIGAGGTAMWERCYLGLPTITIIFAENQKRTTEDVSSIGAIEYLGWSDKISEMNYAQAIDEMCNDFQRVKQISEAALQVVQHSNISAAQVMKRLSSE